MKRLQVVILCVLLLAVSFYAGTRYGRTRFREVTEKVVVDTIFYERPSPVLSSSRTVAVNVPRSSFVSASEFDNLCQSLKNLQRFELFNYPEYRDSSVHPINLSEIPTDPEYAGGPMNGRDSVTMYIELEQRIYEDSLYRAQVSGPKVGQLYPTLDWVEVYNQTRIQTVTKRNRFAVTAGVGAAYTPQGFQPTIGVQFGIVLWGF